MGDLLSLFLAVSLACLETSCETAVAIGLFTIIQAPDFDAYLLSIEVKSIACCQNISGRIVKNIKQ